MILQNFSFGESYVIQGKVFFQHFYFPALGGYYPLTNNINFHNILHCVSTQMLHRTVKELYIELNFFSTLLFSVRTLGGYYPRLYNNNFYYILHCITTQKLDMNVQTIFIQQKVSFQHF